ncbi:hypothetical protein F4778DRAFT_788793 [Xylariomycetidae sp. FL2044]|nr:hypothetical protein F4778DRAFT_788793 [Xylariomycetidae sp. FL2044]
MDAFATAQEPDEGYSEHPLTPSGPTGNEDDTILAPYALPQVLRTCPAFLNDLPTTVISDIVMNQLNPRLYTTSSSDYPLRYGLKILGYLDSVSSFTSPGAAWDGMS